MRYVKESGAGGCGCRTGSSPRTTGCRRGFRWGRGWRTSGVSTSRAPGCGPGRRAGRVRDGLVPPGRRVRGRTRGRPRVGAVHGHFLPPATAVWDGYPVGTWAKNQRTAARLADTIAERRGAGLPVESSVKALTEARREALEEIDPAGARVGCGWQRCFRLAQAHVETAGRCRRW
ncbi:helicase associated domain-containing protein [Streptomyces mobaraensis]|uniref:helicase associated domain-containing protein n=1 Tax=Streptomyces mobaraensis TaxID=35621 RepID=UPI0037DA24DE